MRIRIRDPKTVLHQRPMFPKCIDWLIDNACREFDTLPENHVHIMDGDVRRTIPAEYVEVIG